MKIIRWAMIGCGQVTEVKSGPGLYKSEHSELMGVFNRNYEKAKDYANRHGIKTVYKSVEDLFKDPTIDVVYIATPPVSHKMYAVMCLDSGKIPYIEKPLGMNYEECLAIKDLADKKGLPVYVAFYRRGLEKFLKIKSLLEAKKIGNIRYVHVMQTMKVEAAELDKASLPWRVIPSISGGGKFLDVGVHVLDCLAFYFGEMTSIHGLVQNKGGYYEAEDTLAATFQFESGLIGSGIWSYVADQDKNEVQIVGDLGRILYDGLSAESFVLEVNGKQKRYEFDVPKHIAMPFEQAIVNELIGKDKSFASFEQAINIAKMTDELLKPYYHGDKHV